MIESGAAARPPAVLLSTEAVAPHERFSFWRETMRRVACPLTVSDGGGEFYGTLLARPLGAVTMLDSNASGHLLTRGRGDIARGTVDSYFVFQQLGTVSSAFRTGNGEFATVCGGDLFIGNADEPFESLSTCFQQRRVWVVPRALVPGAAEPARLGRGLHLRGSDAMARILTAYLNEIHRQAGDIPAAAAPPLAENVARLLLAAAAPPSEEARAPIDSGQLALVRREIDRRLADPLLSPPRVALACGISTRKLHALFEPTGESFSRYLMRRRLAAARALLTDPAASPTRSITDIAFSLGFNSLATFYRGYQNAFGESPGDTRSARPRAG